MNEVRAGHLLKRRSKGGQRVRLWHETDMPTALRDVRSQEQSGKYLLGAGISPFGTFRTSQPDSGMSAVGGRAEVVIASPDFRV
jgi:hypothetical protein